MENNLYRLCEQYGVPPEHRGAVIDAYMKFVIAGLSPDFYALHNILNPYVNGAEMEGLTEGRIVHFVLPNGEHRPAMVVKVWDKAAGYVNLQVFTNGSNDVGAYHHYAEDVHDEVRRGIRWETSVYPDEDKKEPRSWHWIEKA